jgi:two-component system, OmpR family, sensor histidine kinase MprB
MTTQGCGRQLARGGEVEIHQEMVRLDLVTAAAADRIIRDMPHARLCTRLEPCTVLGDAEMLERAVGNLLDNAVKWSPPGGQVQLTVSAGEIGVSDEGPGITAADLPFVFDHLYRSAAVRGRPGSRLGLAIVRQIAELHGGPAAAARLGAGSPRWPG